MPTVEHQTAADGTTVVNVHYSITNSGTSPILDGRLEIRYDVYALGESAENSAEVISGGIPVELAPGATHWGNWPLQVDAGSWTIFVKAYDKSTGEILAVSEMINTHVAGHETTAPAFDETRTYALTVTITQFEQVNGALFRVHYDLHCDRDVPAGLNVVGSISGANGSSTQNYDLTTGLSAGRGHPHYLSLEAARPDHVTATITVDPGGPSETSGSVEVDIAADGTSTIRP